MAKFSYQARVRTGQVVTGQIEATDDGDARVKLKAKGLTPLRLVSSVGPRAQQVQKKNYGKVATKDLQIFTRQFATLINAGIPILDALKIMSEGKKVTPLKTVLADVSRSLESGKKLGDALAQHPKVFEKFFINMIRAGEEAGILDTILLRLSSYLEKSEKVKRQVKGALVLPGLIVAVAILVVGGILFFIIPKFQEFYEGAGQDLPGITQLVVNLSDLLLEKWYYFLGGIFGIPFGLLQWSKTPEGKSTIERTLIRVALVGDLIQKAAVAKVSRTLSTLLSSGVDLLEALEISSKTAGNIVIEEALLKAKESLVGGKSLSVVLAKERYIPEMVTQMTAIGEKSGTLDNMMGKIADFYEDEVENAVKALTTLIEPILMVGLGGTIAFLMIAMYLPVFNVGNVVGQ